MIDKDIRFGDYLKQLISEAGYTQNEFYTQLGIKKPYFYDIISGRTNPPPPYLQFKALEILHADDKTKELFFNLAAKERGELPADIIQMVEENPDAIAEIRNNLRKYKTQKYRMEENYEHTKNNYNT